MSKSYYGGLKVMPATVRKLEATSFAELVARYFNVPHKIAVTREFYQSQPKDGPDGQDALKNGPYVTAVTFKEGETHRCDANADKITMACLDIDDPKLAAPFVESPEALLDALWPLNFVAYTTASSTPERPKLRVMIDTEVSDLKHHKAFVRHGANLIGLPKTWAGSRESNVLSQPMFKPVQFDGEEFTSVIISRTTGEELQLIDIPQETDEEIKSSYAYQGEDGDCDLMHVPIHGLTVEDLREPLFKIDPDVDYKLWTEIASSLRHQFRTEEQAEEAFHLFDDWSRTGSKFCEGDTEAKWKSFRPDPRGKRPITIRSLFKYAMDAGWQSNRLVAKVRLGFEEWLAECTDRDLLIHEGPERIASMPFRTSLTDKEAAGKLQARLKALKSSLNVADIMKEVSRERVTKIREEDDGNLPWWLRPWCYVTTIDKWYNTTNGELLSPEAFNRTYSEHMMGPEDAKSGRPSVLPCDFALNIKCELVKKVGGVIYDPRWQGQEPFFEKDGRTYVNAYLASSIPAMDERGSAKVGKIIRLHLKKLIREKAYREILLDWLCYVVQNPGRKIRWVPVIQSAQGAGKSIILWILGAAIGKGNVKLVNPGTMASNFNDWGFGAQVIGLEEIRVQGKSRSEVMNKLKDITANDYATLNAKHKDAVTVENVANFIAFTNYHDALYLEEDDRRYFVIKSAIQSKSQKQQLEGTMVGDMKYFECLSALLKLGGAVRHYFMHRTISADFNPDGDAPDTVYRRQMIEESKNPLQLQIEDLIRGGEHPLIAHDVILLSDLELRTQALSRSNHSPSHFLYQLGYVPWNEGGKIALNGHKSPVWVHGDRYIPDFGTPEEILRERYDLAGDDSI